MYPQHKVFLFIVVVVIPTLAFVNMLILRRNVKVLVKEAEHLWGYVDSDGREHWDEQENLWKAGILREKRLYGIFRASMK